MTNDKIAVPDFLFNLKKMRRLGLSLKDYCQARGWRRIGIYGGGNLGFSLYEEFSLAGVEIAAIIDANPVLSFPYSVDVITPQDIHPDNDCDVIIITTYLLPDGAGKTALAAVSGAVLLECPELLEHMQAWHSENEYARLLAQWEEAQGNGCSIEKSLAEYKNRDFIIYGSGIAARFCHAVLSGAGIKIKCLLEDSSCANDFTSSVPVYRPETENVRPVVSRDDVIVLAHIPATYARWSYRLLEMRRNVMFLGNTVLYLDDYIGRTFVDFRTPEFGRRFDKICEYISANDATFVILDNVFPVSSIKAPSLYEKMILRTVGAGVTAEPDVFPDGAPDGYVYEMMKLSAAFNVVGKNRSYYQVNPAHRLCNVINGCRMTTDAPDDCENSILFFGPCHVAGYFAEDRDTIPSQLQRLINESPFDSKRYRVVNHGANTASFVPIANRILTTPVSRGDIVVLMNSFKPSLSVFKEKARGRVFFFDLTKAFERPHDYGEVFLTATGHMAQKGYALCAGKVHAILSEVVSHVSDESILCAVDAAESGPIQTRTSTTGKTAPLFRENVNTHALARMGGGMQEFLTYLQSEKAPVSGRIGAIVMNCNPFTLGHRYLVESARKEVDFLYLFCVEEDKSEFSFADRIRLMRMGVDDLKNVKVLRSGEFVLSSATFPEYFGKSVLPDVTVDASLDVEIFARQIAPALDISVRFAGSEPNCPITRQYNAAMREVLPGYGIEVVVFDRMEAGGAPVSASTVRRLLKDGDFDAIRGLVPSSTLQYLLERREIERRI